MATRRRLGRNLVTKKALEIEGIPEITRKAQALMAQTGYGNRKVAEELKRGLMKGALIVRDEARDIVPVVTGRLKSAIFAAYGAPNKADVLVGVNTRIAVDPNNPQSGNYAGIVEFGDDERAPRPYMRPAIAAAKPTVARIVKEELAAAVEKLADKA